MYYPIVHCLVFLPFASKKTIGREKGGFVPISHDAGIVPDYHKIFPLVLGAKTAKDKENILAFMLVYRKICDWLSGYYNQSSQSGALPL